MAFGFGRRRELGRPVASCAIRLLVGFGKGKPLRNSPLRRGIDPAQATAAVTAAASHYFPGFTVTNTRGVFMREGEPGVAIDLYRTQYDTGGCKPMIERARCLATDIRTVLRQHSVLLLTAENGGKRTSDIVTRSARGCKVNARRAALLAARRA